MLTLTEILESQERDQIEFKKCASELPKDFWETYSAFANTKGGYVVLGISEPKPYTFEVSGIKNHRRILDNLFNNAASKEKVNYNLLSDDNIVVEEKDGKYVLIIYIPELAITHKPLFLNDNIKNTYIRKNSGDYRATIEELKRFMRNSDSNIDNEILNGYTIDDLDNESILQFKIIVNERRPDKRYLEMKNIDFLKEMGVFRIDRNDNRKFKLTLGGLLFLGTDEAITSKVPHFHLDYLNKKGNNPRWIDRVSSGDLNYQNLNLFKFYNIVLNKLLYTIQEPFELDEKSVRKSSSELEILFREALVNMLVHADYLDRETPIRAEVHDFFYTFLNPGTMKISKEQFFVGGHSEPRNNVLITLFKKIGASEKEGGGGREIFNITQNKRFRLPELESDLQKTFLKIWIAIPEDSFPEFTDETRRVLLFIKTVGTVSFKEIEDKTKLSYHYVRKAVNELKEKKYIIVSGKGKSTKYLWNLSKIERVAAVDKLKEILLKDNM